jgi:adenosylcobinamide-GDP ribazoletransferase
MFGACLFMAQWYLPVLFPAPLAAGLVVALWVALTGGLHLDGLADCCDGLLASATPERRLEIMRDSRLGAFGGIGLILYVGLKILAVASLMSELGHDFMALTSAYLLAPTLARYLLLFVARLPSARPGGLGASFAKAVKPSALILGAILPAMAALLGGWRAVAATIAAALVVWGAAALARARLGGVTGDVLGLSVELAELAVLLVYAAYV